MIDWIKFRWQQHKIHEWLDGISRAQKVAEDEASAKGANAQELHDLGYSFFSERQIADDELIRLTSDYYVRLANRLLVPVPEFETVGGAWMESEVRSNRYHLRPEALHELRSSIRAEQKARREEWTIWLAALTGIIGALSGLIAIIKK